MSKTNPKLMKAVVYEKYGSPSVLQLKEVEMPVPQDKELLIRVHATTVNRTDCAMLSARPWIMRLFTGLLQPRNPILGTAFAGRVEAVGKDVASFKIGDRVFGFDDSGASTYAQYMTFSEDKGLAKIPATISDAAAAASIEGVHYAYNFINKVTLTSGQKVLVNGATGAIGSAAVQLLKNYNVHITAVCNTKNLDLVKSLGADWVIDYTQEDFTQTSETYDYVFDAVGKSSFAKCQPLLKPGGVYISSELGWMVQNPLLALMTPLLGGKKVVFPFPTDIKGSVLLVKKLMEEGKFEAVIDRAYTLEDIADTFRYVQTGQKTGNVVITIAKP